MKYTILALALLAAFNASATGNECRGNCTGGSTTHFNQAQSMLQGQAATGGDAETSAVTSISFENKRNPVSSAIAPAIDVNVICPVVTVGGHAVQFIGFGGSTTGKANINAICMAFHLEQFDVVQAMLCNTDGEYRKANVKCTVK